MKTEKKIRKPGSGGARPGSGRPRKVDGHRKTRSIMLTDAEYSRLTEIAEVHGVTRSEMVARMITGNF